MMVRRLRGLGQSSLLDEFQSYWTSIKDNINTLLTLDTKINQQGDQIQAIKDAADAQVNAAISAQAAAAIDRNLNYYSIWSDIRDKINAYLPAWVTSAGQQAQLGPGAGYTQDASGNVVMSYSTTATTTGTHGLGQAVVIVLGAVALAALAYVAVNGLKLLKDVNAEDQVIAGMQKGLLSTQQAKALLPHGILSPASSGSFFSMGSTLALLLAAGAIGFIFLFSRR